VAPRSRRLQKLLSFYFQKKQSDEAKAAQNTGVDDAAAMAPATGPMSARSVGDQEQK
jgi:hypothetical protein